MKILTIDTSTETLGVSLIIDGIVSGEMMTHIQKDHSTRLMPAIVSLMEQLEVSPEELTKIIVGKGPGSYTGVRIGVTTAKSLAWALNIPVIAVSSLQLLSYNGQYFDGLICPFFDARRNNVYTGLYEWKDNKIIEIQPDIHVVMDKWLDNLKESRKKILFLSPNIDQYEEAIVEKMGDQAVIPLKNDHHITPRYLFDSSIRVEEDNVHLLSPNYIRLAEAEVNWLKRQEGAEQNDKNDDRN